MLGRDKDENSTSASPVAPEDQRDHHEDHSTGQHVTSPWDSSARERRSTRTERLPPRRSIEHLTAVVADDDRLTPVSDFIVEILVPTLLVRHLPCPLHSTCTPSRRGSRHCRTSRCTRSTRDRSLHSRLHFQWPRQGVSRPQIGQLPSRLSRRRSIYFQLLGYVGSITEEQTGIRV